MGGCDKSSRRNCGSPAKWASFIYIYARPWAKRPCVFYIPSVGDPTAQDFLCGKAELYNKWRCQYCTGSGRWQLQYWLTENIILVVQWWHLLCFGRRTLAACGNILLRAWCQIYLDGRRGDCADLGLYINAVVLIFITTSASCGIISTPDTRSLLCGSEVPYFNGGDYLCNPTHNLQLYSTCFVL